MKTPTKAKAQDDEAKQKKKSDELWASFLSDVGSRPKESAPQSGTAQKVNIFETSIFHFARFLNVFEFKAWTIALICTFET